MTLQVINDTHIGVERVAGTTVETRFQLRQHVLKQFAGLLPDCDLLVLGDLFDSHNVAIYDVLQTYQTLKQWLTKGHKLYLVAGNHDLSKTSNIMSSFDMLGKLLQSVAASGQVQVYKEPAAFPYGYIIPHLPNQEQFDKVLAEVPECKTLYLHCNYANHFAAQSDQSLNLSKEQAEACKANQIVIAHEHNCRQEGKVLLPGNQIATSISDWVSSPLKYYLFDGALVPYTSRDAAYVEQDWRTLTKDTASFVRVVGDATAEEASQVVSAISKFRAISPALVVTNAVNIASGDGLGDFSNNLEAVSAFDVWKALGAVLSEAELETLKGLT